MTFRVNPFLSIVRIIVPFGFAILPISFSVAVGLGMFWSKVMASMVWKALCLNGV